MTKDSGAFLYPCEASPEEVITRNERQHLGFAADNHAQWADDAYPGNVYQLYERRFGFTQLIARTLTNRLLK